MQVNGSPDFNSYINPLSYLPTASTSSFANYNPTPSNLCERFPSCSGILVSTNQPVVVINVNHTHTSTHANDAITSSSVMAIAEKTNSVRIASIIQPSPREITDKKEARLPIKARQGVIKRRRGRKPIDKSGFFCYHCSTKVTPEWRKGPNGPNTLCNACGLQFAKVMKSERERKNGTRKPQRCDIASMLNLPNYP
jgi:hypothetical protein